MEVTRRAGLLRGTKLAFIAPAVVAAMHVGTAFADDDDDKKKHPEHPVHPAHPSHPSDADHPSHPSQAESVLAMQALRISFRSDLGRVSNATASDFTSSNAGSDPLSSGQTRVVDAAGTAHDGRVLVSLRGAAANAGYKAQFVRFNGGGREDIGTFTTNADGNFSDSVGVLSGDNRVGLFVIVRSDSSSENGKDEFVSTIHT